MKIKKGLTWKNIDGIGKGKEFTVISVDNNTVQYKSLSTGVFYEEPRKNFEKRMERVAEYWNRTNKEYKTKRQNLRIREDN